MKKSRILAVLCLTLLLAATFVACNQTDTYRVEFFDGADRIDFVDVPVNTAITADQIPDAPAKSGMEFVGWLVRGTEDTYVTEGFIPSGHVIAMAQYVNESEDDPGVGEQVSARFSLGEYTGDGSAPVTLTVDKGGAITFPAVEVDWEGYAFLGWKADGDDTLHQAGESITLDADATFVAQWNKLPDVTYTVHFDLGEYEGGQAPADVVVGDGESTKLPSVKWAGHDFLGWKIGEESTLHQAGEDYPVTGEVTFVAQWRAIDYTISFELGVYTGSDLTAPAEQTGHLNESIELPGALTWAEHTFKGWKNNQTGNTYDAGAQYNILGNATLIAQWESVYTVSDLEGVWLNAGSQAYAVIETTEGGKLNVKGYVDGSYNKIDVSDVTYDKSVGQFSITIKKDYAGQQTEVRTYVIRDHQLHISGTGTLETTLTKQEDESLSGKYFYHDNTDGDEYIEVITGGVIVDMKAKVFESNTNVPVFAAIVKEDESYKLIYKMSSSSGYGDLDKNSFAVLESGHLWIKCAYGSGNYKLFVKGATAGVTYSGPNGASLYKYTVDGGYVYTVKERALGENLLATVDGDVADGQIFTIKYNNGAEVSKIAKLSDGSFAYASEERGTYSGEKGELILDGFGGGTLGGQAIVYRGYSSASKSVVIDGNNYILNFEEHSYTVEEGADKWMGRVYTYQSSSSTCTLTFDGFGNAKRTISTNNTVNNYTYEFSEDERKVTFSDGRNSYDSVVLYHGFVIRYAMFGGVTGDNYEMAATIDDSVVGYYTLSDGKLLNVTKWYFAISSADGDEQYTTVFTDNDAHTQYSFSLGGNEYTLTLADGQVSVNGAQVSKATFFTNDTYYADHNKVEVGVNDLDVTFKYFGGNSDSLSAYYMAYEDGKLTYTAYGKQSSYEGTYKFTVESGELYLTATSGKDAFDIDHVKLGTKEADIEFVFGEYHMTGSDITLTYTKSGSYDVIILAGGDHDGTYNISVSYSDDPDYITVNSVQLIWEIWGSTIQLRCKSSYSSSEYAGEYTLDHIVEPDIYPEDTFGTWVSDDGTIKVKINAKHFYIWGPEDDGWVECEYLKYSVGDYIVDYKGNEIAWWSSSKKIKGQPFSSSYLQMSRSVFSLDMVGYFKTADEQYVTISVKGLVYRHGESIGAATNIEEQAENDFTFAFDGENYRVWKDGETLKLSKQDGTNEQELTEAQPDSSKARFVLATNTTNHIEFDGCGNFLQSASADNSNATTGYYIVNEDGDYVVSGCSSSRYNGTWKLTQNGNVISNSNYTYEREAVIKLSGSSYGTYIGTDIVLIVGKWSVSASTPTHNEFEETDDITVLEDGGYQFTIGGQQHTLSGTNTLLLDGSALNSISIPHPGGNCYAYHNIISITSNAAYTATNKTAIYVGSELIYSATVEDTPYDFKIEQADGGDKYFVRFHGEEQWYELTSIKEKEEYDYPHGVWKREGDDKQITITGAAGNYVAYTFAVDGGSTATTSSTWYFISVDSYNNIKRFTVEIDGVTYKVGGYGSVLYITSEDGPNDLDGVYVFDSAVAVEYFTDAWLGTWATADSEHTVKISDHSTLQYKNVEDDQFYDVLINVSTTKNAYNITIQGGIKNGNKLYIEYKSSTESIYIGTSTSSTSQMFRTIFPSEWVGNYKTEDGQYINIAIDSVSYAENYHSELVAMSGYTETSATDFFVTIGGQEYRIWNDGTLKISTKDGENEQQLTQRDADFMVGKFVDPSYPTKYYLIFDGFGNVFVHNNSSDYNGTYYFNEEYTTVTIVAEYKGGEYTLEDENRTLKKGIYNPDIYKLESPFSDIQGTYIGEGVVVTLKAYSIVISTTEHEAAQEIDVADISVGDGEFRFNANGQPCVLTNSAGALELDGTPLAKLSTLGKFYANDNEYIVVFKDAAIAVNETDSSKMSAAFVDGKLTFTFTVGEQEYTVTKEGDAYKLSVGGSQYDMSATPTSPATIFGTWTKDDVTWTFDYQADRATTRVYLTVTGGANAGVYDVKDTYDTKSVTRQIEINSVQYTAKITKQTLTVTSDGENEYNGTYTKTATTEPDIVDSKFVGVSVKSINGTNCVLIITTKHIWVRPQADKGGQFEDFYDLVPNGSASRPDYLDYTDIEVYWVSLGNFNLWGTLNKIQDCSATTPEEYLLWESSQEG